ncbi:MAG: pilus assembly protein, partial [Frankiaceae bacterium]|nr:pilus assembly protein [Frankiaceae bacterium]
MPAAAADRRDGERGAAVVEFRLVSVVLVFLFLLVMQVGLVLHARNVLV